MYICIIPSYLHCIHTFGLDQFYSCDCCSWLMRLSEDISPTMAFPTIATFPAAKIPDFICLTPQAPHSPIWNISFFRDLADTHRIIHLLFPSKLTKSEYQPDIIRIGQLFCISVKSSRGSLNCKSQPVTRNSLMNLKNPRGGQRLF